MLSRGESNKGSPGRDDGRELVENQRNFQAAVKEVETANRREEISAG